MTESFTLESAAGQRVSALVDAASSPQFVYVLAHGAGAGMRHPFLQKTAEGLVRRGGAVVRYQFPYMEAGRSRVDSRDICVDVVQAAVRAAAERHPGVPVVAGGKSFGGRMTSEAQARGLLPDVRAMAFLGYPWHPPGKPSLDRVEHFARVTVPMLFLQGTRDEFATQELLQQVVEEQRGQAHLVWIADGDHSFAVRKSSGRDSAAAHEEVLDVLANWIRGLPSR